MHVTEGKSDNGCIVSFSSCDELKAAAEGFLCVFPQHPCGASVTAGWSHLTNHDIMFPLGRFHLSSLSLLPSLHLSIRLYWCWTSCLCRAKPPKPAHFPLSSSFVLLFLQPCGLPRRNEKYFKQMHQTGGRKMKDLVKKKWRMEKLGQSIALVSFTAWHNTLRPTHSKKGIGTCSHSSQAYHTRLTVATGVIPHFYHSLCAQTNTV